MRALIFFIAVSVTSNGLAQTVRQDTIYCTAQSYGDSIVLRWAPGSSHLWKVANKYGYKVERKKVGEKEFRAINTTPLKPYTLKEWKQKADTTNVHVATAAQVLLGEVMMKPENAASFSQKLLTSEEERNRLALGLYSAEFSIQAANGLALRWVDRDIEKDDSYFYKVSLYSVPRNYEVVSSIAKQRVSDVYTPRPVQEVIAEGKDGLIEIRWEKKENDRYFSGYFVERSEDGKKFTRLSDIPFKTVEDSGLEVEHKYEDKITVYGKDFFYRVIGVTSFADYGSYSEVVKAHTADLNGPAPPSYIRAESMTEKSIKLTWTDNPVAPDHAGYFIGRGTSIHGPFERLNTKPLKTTLREYIDEKPILHKPNFYTIIAVDKLGNENQSVVAMSVLKDATPPAVPVELTGHVDTLGVVSLAWRMGSEEDLMGYRVYRADHPDAEYIQITNAPIPGNFYMDTIPLNTLTKKVYYKVAAFDFNYNPSPFSTVLELKRPDYSPPVKPLVKGYTVKKDTVQLQLIASSSKDVARHIIYRKESDGEWQPLAEFEKAPKIYNDLSATPGTTYSYAVEAIDEAGLHSGKSRPVLIKTSPKEVPAVTNIKGTFDKNTKTFTLDWEYKEKGSYKFIVYRSVIDEPLSVYGSATSASTNFTDNEFYRNEKGYVYAVKVLFSDGTESSLSETVTAAFKKQ